MKCVPFYFSLSVIFCEKINANLASELLKQNGGKSNETTMEYPSPLSDQFANVTITERKEGPIGTNENLWNTTILENLKSRGIFLSLQSILDFLRQPEPINTTIPSLGFPQLIFVQERSSVAHLVSRMLRAKYILNPHGKLAGVSKLPTTFDTRRAYYCLTKYSAANVAAKMLRTDPVVMERYWLDQITFALAKTFKSDLPPLDSGLYEWPKDLLKPDLTFFINADNKSLENYYQPNEINNFTINLLQVYDHFKKKIPIIEISSNQSLLAMVKEVVSHIQVLGPDVVKEKKKAARPLD